MWPHLIYTERLKDTFTAHSTLQLHSARVHHPLLTGLVVMWLLGCSRPFHTGSRMGMMEIQPPPWSCKSVRATPQSLHFLMPSRSSQHPLWPVTTSLGGQAEWNLIILILEAHR